MPRTDDLTHCDRYTGMNELLLHQKNAIIYGAGGGIGSGVAVEFARQGARLFLAGRTREPLERVAEQATALGAPAQVTVLDALDEDAIERHADSVVQAAGRIDVSINLISRGDVQGTPLIELSAEDLMAPVVTGLRTNFLTARAAARRMTRQGSGVILTVTSGSSHATGSLMGGTGPADAAIESMLRCLAAETGPQGVRVLGVWTAGVPETFELAHDTNPARRTLGLSAEQIEAIIAPRTMLGRAPHLDQVAQSIAFLASDRASAITGTTLNVTCGLVPGP
jgi:NAD(P)-dependent dehydrogenase (short-subunit alcohol dehydrogenase family)